MVQKTASIFTIPELPVPPLPPLMIAQGVPPPQLPCDPKLESYDVEKQLELVNSPEYGIT